MAEEERSLLTKCLTWMQRQEEEVKDEGIHLEVKGVDYTFLLRFVDR